MTGEIAGYAWDPHGAGASVALMGLVGGLLVWLLRRNGPVHLVVAVYVVGLVAALCGAVIQGTIGSVVLGALLGSICLWLIQLHAPTRLITSFVGGVGLLGAVVLTAYPDIHGPALLAGACMAALMLWRDPRVNGLAVSRE